MSSGTPQPASPKADPGARMLEIRKLEVRLAGIKVLDKVDLRVDAGQMCGLRGHNGAGKTTLVRTVMGLVKASAGDVQFGGKHLLSLPGYARARLGIGYMPEDRRLVPTLTAEENILSPVWATHIEDGSARLAWIYNVIPEIKALSRMPSSSLSGGQQKLVALGRALMIGRNLLLLDEPTEGVAPALAARLMEILREIRTSNVPVLIAESNNTAFESLLDNEFVLDRGTIESMAHTNTAVERRIAR